MDLKTKLCDESIFSERPYGIGITNRLVVKGIHTVEDFINCDIHQMSGSPGTQKQFRAFQKILRYKYLDEPLTTDILLEKEYNNEEKIEFALRKDMIKLGFSEYCFNGLAKEILDKNGSCKMIDIISSLDEKFDYLKDFYVAYYNTQKRKENENKEEESIDNDKKSLDTLKNELVCLLNQRNELDTKISSLLEQINTRQGGKTNNARK